MKQCRKANKFTVYSVNKQFESLAWDRIGGEIDIIPVVTRIDSGTVPLSYGGLKSFFESFEDEFSVTDSAETVVDEYEISNNDVYKIQELVNIEIIKFIFIKSSS